MVEHSAVNRKVVGSSPTLGAIFSLVSCFRKGSRDGLQTSMIVMVNKTLMEGWLQWRGSSSRCE